MFDQPYDEQESAERRDLDQASYLYKRTMERLKMHIYVAVAILFFVILLTLNAFPQG